MRLVCCLSVLMAAFYGNTCLASGKAGFHVEKVTDRIFLVRPEKLWRVNSSNVVYVGKNGLILVDGQADPELAREMLQTIERRISRLPILYVLLTHHHMDHIGGVAEIKRLHPQAQVIAQEAMADTIRSHSEAERRRQVDQWLRPLADEKAAQSRLAEDKSLRRKLMHDASELNDYIADIESIRFYTPDISYRERMSLRIDETTVNLIHPGHAHTPSDTLIYFPGDKALVTGDLFHNLDPLFWAEADPDGWVNVMQEIAALDVRIYLGGHGDSISDRSVLESWAAYMRELITLVKAAKTAGESLQSLQTRINDEDIKSLTKNEYGSRIQLWGEKLMNFEDSMDARLDRELEGLWQHY